MTTTRAIVVTGAASGIGLAVATRARERRARRSRAWTAGRRRPRLSTRGRRRQGSRRPRGVPDRRASRRHPGRLGELRCRATAHQPPRGGLRRDRRGPRHRSRRLHQGFVGGGEGVAEQQGAGQHRQCLVGPRPCRLSGLDGVRHRQSGSGSAHALHRAAVRPAQHPLQRGCPRSGGHSTAGRDRFRGRRDAPTRTTDCRDPPAHADRRSLGDRRRGAVPPLRGRLVRVRDRGRGGRRLHRQLPDVRRWNGPRPTANVAADA